MWWFFRCNSTEVVEVSYCNSCAYRVIYYFVIIKIFYFKKKKPYESVLINLYNKVELKIIVKDFFYNNAIDSMYSITRGLDRY